jgi:hypothetical protein
MKHFTFTLALLLSVHSLCAQSEFAPIGAVWHYHKYEFFQFPWTTIKYYRIEAIGDTLIQGRSCRILETSDPVDCTRRREREYVHQQGDTIRLYDPDAEIFQIMYNFGAQAGDTWTIDLIQMLSEMPLTLTIRVDSITTVNIAGTSLRRYYASQKTQSPEYESDFYPFEYPFTELLGAERYLFYTWEFEKGPLCDTSYPRGLRCYYDPNFGYYETGIAPFCNWIGVPVREMLSEPEGVRVFPNPASRTLHIENLREEALAFDLMDLHGRTLRRGISADFRTEVSVEQLPAGVYQIVFREGTRPIGRTRVVVAR